MKENVKKFREEAEKLEQSDALKNARQKFYSVESEASKGTEVLKEKFGSVIDEVGKTDIAKKASKLGEDFSKSAKEAAGTFSEKTAELGKSQAFQSISHATAVVREEIGSQEGGRVYRAPEKLRKRIEFADLMQDERNIEANTDALGVELHKDSKFYQSWENFKNNNAYVNKVFTWKTQYDESENPLIRASRLLTDKVSDIMGGMFSKTELSETLTEICKVEPNFNEKIFLRNCEIDIIPNILEAMIRGNLEILRDWCFESCYNVIATPIAAAQKIGFYLDSKILDIENVDLAMGKVMEQGPVLIITFQAQQIMCVRDKSGKCVEGDSEKVMRVNYVWVLCRDQNDLNPRSAWRLMELSANSQEQFL